MPVARSRSEVSALATPWRGANKADLPGAGLPCSSGAGYAGRHPPFGGWRHRRLCSSPIFGGFLSRRENITPKGLRQLGSGIFPSRKKASEKWENFSYFS